MNNDTTAMSEEKLCMRVLLERFLQGNKISVNIYILNCIGKDDHI